MRSARECRPARNEAMVLGLRRAVGQGDVQCVAKSRSGTCFVLRPGSGIEREAMDREEPDPLAVVVDLLGAVAVVDVEIDDQNAVEPEPFECLRGRQRNVGEDAKPHTIAREGMMSRRTDQAQSPPIAAAHHVRDCLDGRARRQPGRDHRMWENPCIGIDRSATPRLELFELADVAGFMNPQELLVGCFAHAS